jgi:hypothetical protein
MLGPEADSFVGRQAELLSSGRCCLDPALKEHMMTHWAWEKEEEVERQGSLPMEEGARQLME